MRARTIPEFPMDKHQSLAITRKSLTFGLSLNRNFAAERRYWASHPATD
jgi:hypothetical protein